MHHYRNAMRRYASFGGRASRAEFWQFTLVFILSSFALALLLDILFRVRPNDVEFLISLWTIVHFLPALAVTVRRLHDIDRTGWWVLLNLTGIGSIVGFIFALMPGTDGTNRFGPMPGQDTPMPADPSPAQERWVEAPPMDRREEPAAMPLAPPATTPQAQQSPAAAHPSRPADMIGDLERLSQLRAAGGLSEAEFEALKARTLGGAAANSACDEGLVR